MKRYCRLLFTVLAVLILFALSGCTGVSYYGVNSYGAPGWNNYGYNNRYYNDRYYDDRRDRYIDARNQAARRNYIHQRTNPNRSMRRVRPSRRR